MKYVSYELDIAGIYSARKMYRTYCVMADKSEYPSYAAWMSDMIKSGVFEKI